MTLASHLLLHPALSAAERTTLSSRFAQYNEQYSARISSSCSQSPASTPTVRSASVSPVKCSANSDTGEQLYKSVSPDEPLETAQLSILDAGETDRMCNALAAAPSCIAQNDLLTGEPPVVLAPVVFSPEDAEAVVEADGSSERTSRETSLFSSCTASTNASVVLDVVDAVECGGPENERPDCDSCATPVEGDSSDARVAASEPSVSMSSTTAARESTGAALECSRAAPPAIASRRLSAWLRQLRLHKYEALLSTLSFNGNGLCFLCSQL